MGLTCILVLFTNDHIGLVIIFQFKFLKTEQFNKLCQYMIALPKAVFVRNYFNLLDVMKWYFVIERDLVL